MSGAKPGFGYHPLALMLTSDQGDNLVITTNFDSLVELLADKNLQMKNGIYWCYMEEYGLPNDKIQTLVQEKKGFLVSTAGFDATMLAIGNALFPDRIGVHETGQYLNARTNSQIENYEKAYKKLTAYEDNKIPEEDLPILVRKNMRKPSST